MNLTLKTLAGAAALAAAAALPSAASAQTATTPLTVLVNPLAVPGAFIADPIGYPLGFATGTLGFVTGGLLAPPQPLTPPSYNPAPARAFATGYNDDLFAVVPTTVLKQTGPRYTNTAPVMRGTKVVVIRRGAGVPAYVPTAPVDTISVPGLRPDARYAFFVSPEGKTVILDPATRQVVKILR